MSRRLLPNWLAPLGIKGALPLLAAASAAPSLEASAASPDQLYVVINHEEQYSIWPVGQPLPSGWEKKGKAASLDGSMANLGRRTATSSLYVVINHEEQYSIWPASEQVLPRGWSRTADSCALSACQGKLEPLLRRN